MLTPWFRPAGVELTRVFPWEETKAIPKHLKKEAKTLFPHDEYDQTLYIEEQWKDRYENERTNFILQKGRAWAKQRELIRRFDTDPYCVEVASAILVNWKELEQFFTQTDQYLDQFKLLRFSDEVCGTGGHIHISIENAIEALHVKRFMLNHPEAMFAFCNPDDDHHRLENRDPKYYFERNSYNMDEAEDSKADPIAYRADYRTVEYRMLDVAQTWSMQEEHMAFAQAFTRYALQYPPKKHQLLYRKGVERRSVQEHINRFKALITLLELPWSRYKWYTKNITTRFKFETKNFSS